MCDLVWQASVSAQVSVFVWKTNEQTILYRVSDHWPQTDLKRTTHTLCVLPSSSGYWNHHQVKKSTSIICRRCAWNCNCTVVCKSLTNICRQMKTNMSNVNHEVGSDTASFNANSSGFHLEGSYAFVHLQDCKCQTRMFCLLFTVICRDMQAYIAWPKKVAVWI